MCRITQRAPLCVTLLFVVAGSGSAQGSCTETDSIDSCWQRYITAAQIEHEVQVTDTVSNGILDLVTGAGGAGSDAANTVTNFLPLLALTGFGGNIAGDSITTASSGKDVVIDINLPFFGSPRSNVIKLQTAFSGQPQVYEPVLEKISTAQLDAFKTEFVRQSNVGDDARLSVAYTLVNENFGRSFAEHRDRFESLYEGVTDSVPAPNILPLIISVQRRIDQASQDALRTTNLSPLPQEVPLTEWLPDLPTLDADTRQNRAELRTEIIALIEEAAQLEATSYDAQDARLAQFGVLSFRDLVDNQPQIVFRVTRRERDVLVGPDETTASITVELPTGGNNSQFIRRVGSEACSDWSSQDCLNAFRNYVANRDRLAETSPRLSLSIDYVNIEDYSISLLDPMVLLAQKGSRKLVVSAAFGLRFTGDTRFDVALKLEKLADDPVRNDRTVLSTTWTKQMGDISIPVTLIYSNEPEYLDQQGLGERFSANVGLKYEFKQRRD